MPFFSLEDLGGYIVLLLSLQIAHLSLREEKGWNQDYIVHWSGFSRETELTGCVYREKEMDFKELARVIMEAGRFNFYRVDWQTGAPEESWYCYSSLKALCWQNSLLL